MSEEIAELYREGKYSKCIKALTKAIKAHDPTHTQALALLHANRAPPAPPAPPTIQPRARKGVHPLVASLLGVRCW